MIPQVLAVTLMVTAQLPGAPQRQQFASCLRSFMTAKLEERMAADSFETALAAACRDQETAYRTAYIEAAVRAGDRRPAAERDVGLEVQDLRSNFLQLFRDSQAQ